MPVAGADLRSIADGHRVAQHLARQRRRSRRGIVAEKNRVCRLVGSCRGCAGCRAGSPCRACGRPRRGPGPRGRRGRRRRSACGRAGGPGWRRRCRRRVRSACSCGPMPTPPKTARRGDRRVTGESRQVLVDLHRELARRREDQRAAWRRAGSPMQPLQDRQQERRGLAGAGRGAGDQVAAREGQRDGVGLDRGRPGEAELLDRRFEEIGVEAERENDMREALLSAARCSPPTGGRAGRSVLPAKLEKGNGDCRRGRRSGARRRPAMFCVGCLVRSATCVGATNEGGVSHSFARNANRVGVGRCRGRGASSLFPLAGNPTVDLILVAWGPPAVCAERGKRPHGPYRWQGDSLGWWRFSGARSARSLRRARSRPSPSRT